MSTTTPSVPAAEEDWIAVTADDGRVYFWNQSTDETSWTSPTPSVKMDGNAEESSRTRSGSGSVSVGGFSYMNGSPGDAPNSLNMVRGCRSSKEETKNELEQLRSARSVRARLSSEDMSEDSAPLSPRSLGSATRFDGREDRMNEDMTLPAGQELRLRNVVAKEREQEASNVRFGSPQSVMTASPFQRSGSSLAATTPPLTRITIGVLAAVALLASMRIFVGHGLVF
uniref:WW domain-containing protein n=1 Tax=Haptolina brevifila TaxID=156173 RepID=A0A7S2IHW8_9EUKA